MTLDWAEERMQASLGQRQAKGTLRRLPAQPDDDYDAYYDDDPSTFRTNEKNDLIDFSSNDYLGLAHSKMQAKRVEELYADAMTQQSSVALLLGATGSRLLSGDSSAFHNLEKYLAKMHQQPAALLCNSGYDANLSLVSSLPCNVIIYDEYAHNSLHMGMRLWQSRQASHRKLIAFRHNSTSDLVQKLQALPACDESEVFRFFFRSSELSLFSMNDPNLLVLLFDWLLTMADDAVPGFTQDIQDNLHFLGSTIVDHGTKKSHQLAQK